MNKSPKNLSSSTMIYYINITNLPPSINKNSLLELINSIIQTNLEFEINYKLWEFIIDQHDEDEEEEEELSEVSAILQFDQYYECLSLYNILNGYEWLNKIINVELINNPQDKNGIQHHQPFYDPYYPYYQYPYSHPAAPGPGPGPGPAPPPPPYPNQLPPPPFYYQRRKTQDDSDDTKTNPDYILIKNDEDDELIKVNPCRLFIGNVPYSSNWTSLRNFLVLKSKEMDPTINLGILRVEIPIQTVNTRSKSDSYALPTYPGNFDEKVDMNMNVHNNRKNITKSRGFAIVITSNKESAIKLIEMLDNVEFEGRSLTVRFDKFPDYNNYIIQQLNPSFGNGQGNRNNNNNNHNNHNNHNNNVNNNINTNHHPQNPPNSNLPRLNNILLSNLAFERNSLQQKLYYNNLVYPYYNPIYYPNQANYYDKRKNYNYDQNFRNINYNQPNTYMPSQYPYVNGHINKPVNGNYPYQPQYRVSEENASDVSCEVADSLNNLKLKQ